ncbi:hypothetical protein [Mesorhizobium sp.]|nr:hypothetical protein [Mesorhizobium sp.]
MQRPARKARLAITAAGTLMMDLSIILLVVANLLADAASGGLA